jgi:internalin A
LSKCELEGFPFEITNLSNLRVLDLKENLSILNIPREIGHLRQLEYLDLSYTGLSNLPPEIGELGQLKYFGISQNNLANLPDEISKLINLEYLDLRKNKLKILNPFVGKLYNLKGLLLSENSLSSIPSEVGALMQLQFLDLSSNEFIEFPTAITNLEELKTLLIANNEIPELPKEISRLKNLRVLAVSGNAFSSLPPEIGYLSNIKILVMSRADEDISDIERKVANKVVNIPHYSSWYSYGDIWEYGDEKKGVNSLPKELSLLSKLEILDLRSNNIPIPPEILNKINEPNAILNYYFSVIESNRKPINEFKLILVGQGAVGKTSLVQQILHNTFDQNQVKTEGISLIKWELKLATIGGEAPIIANIWDFGGQEIMHATHQFFLTERSLYLLVLDARLGQDENRIEYWLRMIQSFGGDSPVIVVGNKIDQQLLDIDRRGLQAKYPNIKAFVETSCLDGRGIEELKEVLAREINSLPHVRDLLPESWFQVKEKLENLDKDFIPFSEYETLCNEGGINDETSQSTLIGFLHDLGSMLNFRDDPRLQETNIINPEWVTNGVYRILNSNELFHNKGVLETKQLSQMLDPKAYPRARHMFIVDMMRKFELCYPFEGDEGKYLVPDLLPREEPFTGDWANALAFEFHYSVLPGSIISRFIVRMHPFIHQHTVWRAGVVLKSGENFALVKADYEDKKIFIRVSGERETCRDVLSMVRGTLDAIHKTITGLDAAPKVPHPDYPELVLDYDELIEFEKKGIDSFPKKVGTQVVTVDVRQLLDGVEGKSAPQVFISYAHEDKTFANKLVKSLKAAGLSIWKDDSHIQGGAAWAQEIARGITQSKLVLNLLSPDSLESEFVEKELIYAIDTAKKKVIPLRIKNVQPPLMLANLQYVDFYRKNYEKTFEDLLDLIRDHLS